MKTLSEKRYELFDAEGNQYDAFLPEHVKEFIKNMHDGSDGNGFIHVNKIDELAGSNLIDEKGVRTNGRNESRR
ncbi:MAG: hypothetical protein IH845_05675 [Nanoarchaeota archaeon]|nr:hypothetical protein [Nanoarchaeota archaeon]